MRALKKPRSTLSGIASAAERPNEPSRSVRPEDVPMIKGMLLRRDVQSDIAAYFGTNGGRIAQINTGEHYPRVKAARRSALPPPGPYMAARSAHKLKEALVTLRDFIEETLEQVERWERHNDGDQG